MSKAMLIHETGGPEVLSWEDNDPGKPGPGEALLRHEAVGLNFIDVYHRTGLYPLPQLPHIPGLEGAGVVEETGEGVDEIAVGDRVAYAGYRRGPTPRFDAFQRIDWSRYLRTYQARRQPP